MGSNSTQGLATLLFIVAFTCLSEAFFTGGGFMWIALFVVGFAGSAALFIKAKPWEHAER
jgi:hypothetical protein